MADVKHKEGAPHHARLGTWAYTTSPLSPAAPDIHDRPCLRCCFPRPADVQRSPLQPCCSSRQIPSSSVLVSPPHLGLLLTVAAVVRDTHRPPSFVAVCCDCLVTESEGKNRKETYFTVPRTRAPSCHAALVRATCRPRWPRCSHRPASFVHARLLSCTLRTAVASLVDIVPPLFPSPLSSVVTVPVGVCRCCPRLLSRRTVVLRKARVAVGVAGSCWVR
jgi:hypothetical protein